MAEIIDLAERKKKRKKSLSFPNFTTNEKDKLIPFEYITVNKTCFNCRHYKDNSLSALRTCGYYPNALFHYVTTDICTPETGKVFWSKRPGLFRRIKEFLFN